MIIYRKIYIYKVPIVAQNKKTKKSKSEGKEKLGIIVSKYFQNILIFKLALLKTNCSVLYINNLKLLSLLKTNLPPTYTLVHHCLVI